MTTEPGGVQIRILGTGTSTGVPVIGCSCRVCSSGDQKDKRLRCSCYIEANGLGILIDAGPDFRTQALRYGIREIDAVLITHHHFDHVVGLDDLRPFLFHNKSRIPCYGSQETADILGQMFGYIFKDGSYPGVPNLTMHVVSDSFKIEGRDDPTRTVSITPIRALHGALDVLGFRIGRFAWLTDVSEIPESSLELLSDLDVLVLDALRHTSHPKHFSLSEARAVAADLGAKQTYFIHMTHGVLHSEEEARLPDRIHLAYDGMELTARM